MAKSNEPIVWSLFSAGGVVAALLVPVLVVLLGIAVPLGWVSLNHANLLALVKHPLTKLFLMVLISLPLFHWAHRFRFTLVDLGLKSLGGPIAFLCYTAAVAGTVLTVVMLWKL